MLPAHMTEVLLFHHAQGLTAGCLSFADEVRAAGHVVHVPDLYDGKTFSELEDGIGYAQEVGFGTIAHTLLVRYRSRAVLGLVLIASQAFFYNGIFLISS